MLLSVVPTKQGKEDKANLPENCWGFREQTLMWSSGSLGALVELWPLPVTDNSCALHLSYRIVKDGKDGNCVAMVPAQSASPHFLGSTLGVGSFALYLLQLLLKWHQALHWIPARVYPSTYREIESLVKWHFQPLRRASIPWNICNAVRIFSFRQC